MIKQAYDLLESLVNTPRPTGYEWNAQKIFVDWCKKYADETHTDSYGNAWGIINPGKKTLIAIEGHVDQIGFIINHINDKGFLSVAPVGGFDTSLLPGRQVKVVGEKGTYLGIIGATAIHLQDAKMREGSKRPEFHELYIDIGCKSREETQKYVKIGDCAVINSPLTKFGPKNNNVYGAGLDNVISVWSAAWTLKTLSERKKDLKVSVAAVSCIQEEIGLNGATMVSYELDPDIVISSDVTHAVDTPGLSAERVGEVKLAGGPVVGYGSANHPLFVKRIAKIAEKAKIPLQYEINNLRTGTNADVLFKTLRGRPTVSMGCPNRYMHSPIETICLDDLDNMSKLQMAICLDLKLGEVFKHTY